MTIDSQESFENSYKAHNKKGSLNKVFSAICIKFIIVFFVVVIVMDFIITFKIMETPVFSNKSLQNVFFGFLTSFEYY